MTKNKISVNGRACFLYEDAAATHLLIQPVDEHDLEVLNQEVEAIRGVSDKHFSLVAFMINDWNQELTPWAAPPVFGHVPFGDGAEKTLAFITSQLLPEVQGHNTHLILGGYSLAGLFALWAGYQTGRRIIAGRFSSTADKRKSPFIYERGFILLLMGAII